MHHQSCWFLRSQWIQVFMRRFWCRHDYIARGFVFIDAMSMSDRLLSHGPSRQMQSLPIKLLLPWWTSSWETKRCAMSWKRKNLSTSTIVNRLMYMFGRFQVNVGRRYSEMSSMRNWRVVFCWTSCRFVVSYRKQDTKRRSYRMCLYARLWTCGRWLPGLFTWICQTITWQPNLSKLPNQSLQH